MQARRFYNQKLLRCGYTTGSCAAAAAKAAAQMLLFGTVVGAASLKTPKGAVLQLEVIDVTRMQNTVSCAIQKDSGDDPDVTNGVLVYATATKTPQGIVIDGGKGVGRVTKPGLNQPVGAAAINSVPRQMILDAVMEIVRLSGYAGGLSIVISVPDGEKIAARTFNPRLGVVGGISILGTSGIVEPMSEAALMDTIRTELCMLRAAGETRALLTVGNYADAFSKNALALETEHAVKCGNFIGDTLAAAAEEGFLQLLLVGHIGKLVKLGIGLMNTHSRYGDGRMETMVSCALAAGADLSLLREISVCVTTDAVLELLYRERLLRPAMEELQQRISFYLAKQALPNMELGFVVFTNAGEYAGVLAQSENAEALMEHWRKR